MGLFPAGTIPTLHRTPSEGKLFAVRSWMYGTSSNQTITCCHRFYVCESIAINSLMATLGMATEIDNFNETIAELGVDAIRLCYTNDRTMPELILNWDNVVSIVEIPRPENHPKPA